MSPDTGKNAPHAHAVRTTLLDQRKSVVAKFLFLRSSASKSCSTQAPVSWWELRLFPKGCALQDSALARGLLAPLRRCSPAPPL